MNKIFTPVLLAVIAAIATTFSVSAQSSIDRLINDLEKDKNVQVTYTEHRDPKTKKITKQNTILNGTNKSQADKLWKAFENERQNSVRVTKTRDQSFIIKFQDNKYSSSYVLTVSESGWSLVATKRSNSAVGSDDYSLNIDCGDLDNLTFNSLDALDGLDRLNSLDALKDININGNVTVYDDNGNIIYQSKTVKSSDKSKANKDRRSKSKSKSTKTSIRRSAGRTITTTTTTVNGSTVATSI